MQRQHTECERQRLAHERKLAQQTALAEVGRLALGMCDFDVFLEETVSRTAHVLRVPYANIIEVWSERQVLVHATYGWPSCPEGYIAIEPRESWLVAWDLDGSTAPIIHDFTSSQAPPNLAAQGIITSMNAAIGEGSGVFGTIAVHSPSLRQFTEDEVAFLRAMASLISAAVQKYRREDQLQQLREHVLRCQVQLSRASSCRPNELQAPLQSVIGYLNLLEEQLTGQIDERPQAYLSQAIAGAKRAVMLIHLSHEDGDDEAVLESFCGTNPPE